MKCSSVIKEHLKSVFPQQVIVGGFLSRFHKSYLFLLPFVKIVTHPSPLLGLSIISPEVYENRFDRVPPTLRFPYFTANFAQN